MQCSSRLRGDQQAWETGIAVGGFLQWLQLSDETVRSATAEKLIAKLSYSLVHVHWHPDQIMHKSIALIISSRVGVVL